MFCSDILIEKCKKKKKNCQHKLLIISCNDINYEKKILAVCCTEIADTLVHYYRCAKKTPLRFRYCKMRRKLPRCFLIFFKFILWLQKNSDLKVNKKEGSNNKLQNGKYLENGSQN